MTWMQKTPINLLKVGSETKETSSIWQSSQPWQSVLVYSRFKVGA